MTSIYDIFTDLPLFKGVSHEVMARTAGKFRFGFKKYLPGNNIAVAGQPCRSLIFILSGTASSSRPLPGGLTVRQSFGTGSMLYPDFMFGRSTDYPATVIATDKVSTLEIDKSDYIKILGSDNVFLFNYLNFLSLKGQKAVDCIDGGFCEAVIERLKYIVDTVVSPTSRDIVITAESGNMPKALGIEEESYKKYLATLRDKNILDFDSKSVTIIDRKALMLF